METLRGKIDLIRFTRRCLLQLLQSWYLSHSESRRTEDHHLALLVLCSPASNILIHVHQNKAELLHRLTDKEPAEGLTDLVLNICNWTNNNTPTCSMNHQEWGEALQAFNVDEDFQNAEC
uniref:Uncharacterized protein n=1 Tax=Physcomitrium patens TaxID=3218 RepID=A0A2K1JR78_PHYPA|nr:hypothetical protein PHYPA_016430 [Physcomitrium patens]